MPSFEFDPKKSLSNKRKHGIDFVEAQKLWRNEILEVPACSEPEPRFLVIGKIGRDNWTVVITYRSQSIRIISARRSSKKEVKRYEST